MKITKLLPCLYKLEADNGKVFAKYDKTQIYNEVLLVPTDNISKYIEITKEEAYDIKNSHNNF